MKAVWWLRNRYSCWMTIYKRQYRCVVVWLIKILSMTERIAFCEVALLSFVYC